MNLFGKRRRRVERLLKQYRALLLMNKRLWPESKARIEAALAQVPSLTTKQLIQAEQFYEEQLRVVGDEAGLIASLDEVVRFVQDAESRLPNILYVAKIDIERRLFRRFGERASRWELLPPHTRIGMDVAVVRDKAPMLLDWRLIEGALFEDMAMLWNEAVSNQPDDREAFGDERIGPKKFYVLTRSAIRAAFALLEGYLNGIAVDVMDTRGEVTTRERELLLEIRGPEERFAPLKLRDKILQYPKIALREDYPRFQENNCPEMAEVLIFERQLRDALMHPTQRREAGRELTREEQYFRADLDTTRRIVDAVVGLIRRIDAELDGLFGRVSVWMFDRAADDKYPDETFH